MKYFLAVDGGGSKTKTLCADETGQIIGEGLSGASSLTATSVGAAGFSLRESIRQATQNIPEDSKIEKLVMGLAGMDIEDEAKIARESFSHVIAEFEVKKFILVNDIEIVLKLGTQNPNAIALIAGTGSNCFARNEVGQVAKVGGLDFLLTDQGSGYAIGRRVLREAVKSFDGRSKKSILEELVLGHFQLSNISQLKSVVYNPLIAKSRVAELALICFEAAEAGDQVAKQILVDAVVQLTIMVEAAIRRLQLQDKHVDLVLAGKIATQPFIKDLLSKELSAHFGNLNIIVPDQEPVYGALKMALEQG